MTSVPAYLDRFTLTIETPDLPGRTFLLGDRAGFVLYLPACQGVEDRTLQAIKWFGASGFGRSYFEGMVAAVQVDGAHVLLNRKTQRQLVMSLDGATRVHEIGGQVVRERFFVPDGLQSCVWTVETDLAVTVKPEFDMRYYQAFNTDFSHYRAELTVDGLLISNSVSASGSLGEDLEFFALVGARLAPQSIELLPAGERLVNKTYLKDEAREKLISSEYEETKAHSPDEAPIWDVYQTNVYAPALLHLQGPAAVICAFGDTRCEVEESFARIRDGLPELQRQKRKEIESILDQGRLETGNQEVDTAYAHVLTRFNDSLVARDATLHIEPKHLHHYNAIFAGDKYFMDAWKRDENISLVALLATNDFQMVRAILDSTWQCQDVRTGRLPHIIRAGEPLVYYSSDGTLWALQRLYEYTRASGDMTLLDLKLPMVCHFFNASMSFLNEGLLPSGGIIQKDYLWETWEDTPFTPRAGYPVEIELLWLTVLREFLPFVRGTGPALADSMDEALRKGMDSFKRFVLDGYLADILSYDLVPNDILTPNGYIAFGLDFPLPTELEHSMVLLARDQLAGHRGIRSLAPRDWARVLPAAFLDDPRNVHGKDMASVGIFNYHRGIEWEWLNPFFVAGELKCGRSGEAYRRYVRGQVTEALHEAGIGGLSELYDVRGQLGADFQAWSMAGFVQSLHLFAGVRIDEPEKRVQICPWLPPDWPHLRCRCQVGAMPFDLHISHPTSHGRRIDVQLLGDPPAGYELQLGIRLSPDSGIGSATVNGRPLADQLWSYQDGCAQDVDGTAFTTLPLERHVILEIEIEQG